MEIFKDSRFEAAHRLPNFQRGISVAACTGTPSKLRPRPWNDGTDAAGITTSRTLSKHSSLSMTNWTIGI